MLNRNGKGMTLTSKIVNSELQQLQDNMIFRNND